MTLTAPPPELVERAWMATPAGFARRIERQVWPPHLRLLSQFLVLFATGQIRRLTVSMPPGAGKSTAISRTFPAWNLNLWPAQKLAVASYAATLAVEHGKAARELIEGHTDELDVRLKQDSQAADRWQTTAGGGLWTMGIGGSLTGRRLHKLMVDDPFAGYADSHSEVERAKAWNWWRAVARTRLLPGASACILATRWHEADLIGQVRDQDADEEEWVHLVLPAIAEEDETIDSVLGPETAARLRLRGVRLPAWSREKGRALWPTLEDPLTGESIPWYDEAEMASARRDVGEYLWHALYQGRPSPPEGEMFPVHRWGWADAVPRGARLIRRWDLAATAGGGDATAGALVGRDVDGVTYVVDVVEERVAAREVKQLVRAKAHEDAERYGKRVHTIVEQEPGSAGKSVGEDYVRDVLAGFSAEAKPSTGKKEVRAIPLAAQQQAGFVLVVRRQQPDGSFKTPPWWEHAQEQFRQFPNGAHDDIVDVVSAAYLDLAMRRPSRARAKSAAGRSVAGGAMGSGASRIPSRAGRAR